MQNRFLILPIITLLISCSGSQDPGTAPTDFGALPYPPTGGNSEIEGESNFATLMSKYSEAQVHGPSWSGYWWPYSEDGTASALSNYESVHGGSGAVSWELAHHGSNVPGLQSWWGHCNGWAAAAVLFPEPRGPKTEGGVQFGIGDQKALLSEIGMEVAADYFGHRVENDGDYASLDFQDVFPDQFFLVITNIVGHGRPLVIDRYTGFQVWNQPLAGYRIEPVTPEDDLGADPSAPNIYRVLLTTEIWWARDDVDPDHTTEPFSFGDSPSYESRTLKYELWLDGPVEFDSSGKMTKSGNVVLNRQGAYVLGGDWRNGDLDLANSYPDYMWIPYRIAPSTGYSNPNLDVPWISKRFGS